MNFASDNTAGAPPFVLTAIAEANDGAARSYGDDIWSARMTEALSSWFGRAVHVFPVATGGAANALALAQLTPPWGAIYASASSHIHTDECGAPEFFTSGAKIADIPCAGGKLTPQALAAAVARNGKGNVHSVQPAAVSITNATELGTLYTPEETTALAQAAHGLGLPIHLDGARLANALAALNFTPAALTWQAGIDVLSLGFTKNGALAAEAVVFFEAARAEDFGYRRKRSGHLLSKQRFLSAQFIAMLKGDAWRPLAQNANESAAALAAAFRARDLHLEYPVQANEVFVRLPEPIAAALREAGASFYPWGPPDGTAPLYRFVCSWATRPEEIAALTDILNLKNR